MQPLSEVLPRRRLRGVLVGLALGTFAVLAAPSAGLAQHRRDTAPHRPPASSASPYLSLDHWAYPALDLWIARGDITTLSPMTRPYRIGDVVRAVAGMRPARLSRTEASLRERLLDELAPEPRRDRGRRAAGRSDADRPAPIRVDLGLMAGGRYVSQTHPDPLQAVLDGPFGDGRVLEEAELEVRGSSPYVAGGVRMRRDGIYRHDPRFPDGQVTPPREIPVFDDLSLRAKEAYLELQVPYFRLSFGRLDRNWGPPSIDGFLRSANPYTEDEIGYRLGTERVFLIGSIAAPEDFAGDTTRYLSMHRLEVRPNDRLAIAVSEAALHGGPDGRFRFSLVNPISVWQIALSEEDAPHNKLGQVDVWWRATDGVALNGSLLADATNREGSCCQLGGSVGLELTRLAPGLRVGLQYTAIQSLAYRTARPWEEYSLDGVGLGWDKADFWLATLEAEWFATPFLQLGPRLDLQRKGEGDFRGLRPPAEDLPDQPRLLSGVVETTVRPALAGRWRREGPIDVAAEWDIGISRIDNYAHGEGDDRTVFTGSVAVRLYTPRWSIPLP
jgi:hypothetical protein